MRKPRGVHAEPEAIHVGRALGITPEFESRIRCRDVRDELVEYGADCWGNKETPRREGIGGGVENCLVLQEWIQASGTWRRNRGKGVTFEIEID